MICKYCGELRKDSDFEVANIIKGKVYRRKKCRVCKQNQQNDRRKRIKKSVQEYKRKRGCIRCGFKDYRALTFHHPDPGKKEFTISNYQARGVGVKALMAEIEKCEVICSNCHHIEHHIE